MNEQVVIQHTLKHLIGCEYDGCMLSRDALAAELKVSLDQVDEILSDLRTAAWIEDDGQTLTPSGRAYALHVLRAHRLYETYLASKTGLKDRHWHSRADAAEHKLSADEVTRLDRDLNHPRYDPHGDPIPSATGAMPPKRGKPLTDYPVGWEGRVVHVEDEPPQCYTKISKASIAPGTVVRIEANDGQALRIRAEGCTFTFAVDVARQIAATSLLEGESFDESLERLSRLGEDESATIVGLSSLCRGLERNRMLDLGVVPGTVVEIDLVSPSGSPIAYRIRGASIALRRQQAERILIRRSKEDAHG